MLHFIRPALVPVPSPGANAAPNITVFGSGLSAASAMVLRTVVATATGTSSQAFPLIPLSTFPGGVVVVLLDGVPAGLATLSLAASSSSGAIHMYLFSHVELFGASNSTPASSPLGASVTSEQVALRLRAPVPPRIARHATPRVRLRWGAPAVGSGAAAAASGGGTSAGAGADTGNAGAGFGGTGTATSESSGVIDAIFGHQGTTGANGGAGMSSSTTTDTAALGIAAAPLDVLRFAPVHLLEAILRSPLAQHDGALVPCDVDISLNGGFHWHATGATIELRVPPPIHATLVLPGETADLGWNTHLNDMRTGLSRRFNRLLRMADVERVAPPSIGPSSEKRIRETCRSMISDPARGRNATPFVVLGSMEYEPDAARRAAQQAPVWCGSESGVEGGAGTTGAVVLQLARATRVLNASSAPLRANDPTSGLSAVEFAGVRMYQMWYVAGLVAGDALRTQQKQQQQQLERQQKGQPPPHPSPVSPSLAPAPTAAYDGQNSSHCVGFVADYMNPDTRRAVNALALGCNETFPGSCRVRVLWTGVGANDVLEAAAAVKFWEEDHCHVITHHTASVAVHRTYRTYFALGGRTVGFSMDAQHIAGDGALVSILPDWERLVQYYLHRTFTARAQRRGALTASSSSSSSSSSPSLSNSGDSNMPRVYAWPGLRHKAVYLSSLSSVVPSGVKSLVSTTLARLRSANTSFSLGGGGNGEGFIDLEDVWPSVPPYGVESTLPPLGLLGANLDVFCGRQVQEAVSLSRRVDVASEFTTAKEGGDGLVGASAAATLFDARFGVGVDRACLREHSLVNMDWFAPNVDVESRGTSRFGRVDVEGRYSAPLRTCSSSDYTQSVEPMCSSGGLQRSVVSAWRDPQPLGGGAQHFMTVPEAEGDTTLPLSTSSGGLLHLNRSSSFCSGGATLPSVAFVECLPAAPLSVFFILFVSLFGAAILFYIGVCVRVSSSKGNSIKALDSHAHRLNLAMLVGTVGLLAEPLLFLFEDHVPQLCGVRGPWTYIFMGFLTQAFVLQVYRVHYHLQVSNGTFLGIDERKTIVRTLHISFSTLCVLDAVLAVIYAAMGPSAISDISARLELQTKTGGAIAIDASPLEYRTTGLGPTRSIYIDTTYQGCVPVHFNGTGKISIGAGEVETAYVLAVMVAVKVAILLYGVVLAVRVRAMNRRLDRAHWSQLSATARLMARTMISWFGLVLCLLPFMAIGYAGESYYLNTTAHAFLVAVMSQFPVIELVVRPLFGRTQAGIVHGAMVDPTTIEVLGVLGSGAFGDVYKARWKQTIVALKRIRKSENQRGGMGTLNSTWRNFATIGSARKNTKRTSNGHGQAGGRYAYEQRRAPPSLCSRLFGWICPTCGGNTPSGKVTPLAGMGMSSESLSNEDSVGDIGSVVVPMRDFRAEVRKR